MTIEAWINPANYNEFPPIVNKNQTGPGWTLEMLPDGGVLVFFTGSDGSGVQISGGHAPLGQWTHVAATFDGSAARVYVNGVLVAMQQTSFSTLVSAAGALEIGHNGFTSRPAA